MVAPAVLLWIEYTTQSSSDMVAPAVLLWIEYTILSYQFDDNIIVLCFHCEKAYL